MELHTDGLPAHLIRKHPKEVHRPHEQKQGEPGKRPGPNHVRFGLAERSSHRGRL